LRASQVTRSALPLAWVSSYQPSVNPLDSATRRGEGRGISSQYAAALLYNGLGRYDEALAAAEQACEYDDIGVLGWSLAELVEAAVRSGQPTRASDALQRLSETTSASGTDWALGTEARSRALLSAGQTAENCYREAIERLGRTRMRPATARAHLLYGEWLRRENRRSDARAELRTAHGLFTAMGVEAFAERARRELPDQTTPPPRREHTRCRTISAPTNSSSPGDNHADVAFTFVFSEYENGRQTGNAWYATGAQAARPNPAESYWPRGCAATRSSPTSKARCMGSPGPGMTTSPTTTWTRSRWRYPTTCSAAP
jgi:tetratricopeptide (TPR) repeat protein